MVVASWPSNVLAHVALEWLHAPYVLNYCLRLDPLPLPSYYPTPRPAPNFCASVVQEGIIYIIIRLKEVRDYIWYRTCDDSCVFINDALGII